MLLLFEFGFLAPYTPLLQYILAGLFVFAAILFFGAFARTPAEWWRVIPGWTLLGVVGVGGLQAMAKNGLDVSGQRVVVAGSGPLLLAVAASLAERGAELASICEQTSLGQLARFTLRLLPYPAKAIQGLTYHWSVAPAPYRAGTWVTRALGDHRVEEVEMTDGKRTWREKCDILAVGYGLTPNSELARLLGMVAVQVRVMLLPRATCKVLGARRRTPSRAGCEVSFWRRALLVTAV